MVTCWVNTGAAVVALATAAAFTPTAGAAPGRPGPTTTVVEADAVARAVDSSMSAAESERIRREFASKQARSGRLVDAARVKAARVSGIESAWDDSVKIDRMALVEETVAGTPFQGVMTTAHVDAGDEQGGATARGLGLEGVNALTGAVRQAGGCVSTTTTGGTVTTCWERFKLNYRSSTEDFYYYNRWATAVGTDRSWDTDWKPKKIDIRSRPWRGNTSVRGLKNYWPKAGQDLCKEAGDVSVSYQGFSTTIPIQDCKSITPIPNATSITMGSIYDQGTWVSGRAHGNDFGMVFSTTRGGSASMADYTYALFTTAMSYVPGVSDADGNLRKDSGW